MENRNYHLPPPPSAVNALVHGFNTVANNLGVTMLPVLFDFFLWLGPQLKAKALVTPFVEMAGQMPDSAQSQSLMAALNEFANGFNLFAILRTYPFGIYSLMTTNLSLQTPLAERFQIDPERIAVSAFLVLALTIAGWLGGGMYYRMVAGAVFKENTPSIFRSLLHTLLLSGFWMVFFLFFNIPALILLGVLGMLNATLRAILLILLSIPFSWFLIGVFYSAHGIYANRQNAFHSAWSSFRMVRYSLPNIGWFSIMAVVLSEGMNLLWRIPPASSWMTAVGILAHAFVATSLLAASFFYYRDINVWIESALKWLKANNPSSARA
ncbi:MAG: hypothetical protein OHK0010_26500 [Anaerolineales bacterium]